jgi:hypothetical protein
MRTQSPSTSLAPITQMLCHLAVLFLVLRPADSQEFSTASSIEGDKSNEGIIAGVIFISLGAIVASGLTLFWWKDHKNQIAIRDSLKGNPFLCLMADALNYYFTNEDDLNYFSQYFTKVQQVMTDRYGKDSGLLNTQMAQAMAQAMCDQPDHFGVQFEFHWGVRRACGLASVAPICVWVDYVEECKSNRDGSHNSVTDILLPLSGRDSFSSYSLDGFLNAFFPVYSRTQDLSKAAPWEIIEKSLDGNYLRLRGLVAIFEKTTLKNGSNGLSVLKQLANALQVLLENNSAFSDEDFQKLIDEYLKMKNSSSFVLRSGQEGSARVAPEACLTNGSNGAGPGARVSQGLSQS